MYLKPADRQQLLSSLRKLIAFVESVPVTRGCETCMYYEPPHCKQFEAIPPTEVILEGCDGYVFDEIPF